MTDFSEKTATIFLTSVSYTHLRAHETRHDLVCRLLLEKKKLPTHGSGEQRRGKSGHPVLGRASILRVIVG